MLVDVDDSDSTTAFEPNSARATLEATFFTPVEHPGPIVATGLTGNARHAFRYPPHEASLIVALMNVSGKRSNAPPSVLLLMRSMADNAASHSSPVQINY